MLLPITSLKSPQHMSKFHNYGQGQKFRSCMDSGFVRSQRLPSQNNLYLLLCQEASANTTLNSEKWRVVQEITVQTAMEATSAYAL